MGSEMCIRDRGLVDDVVDARGEDPLEVCRGLGVGQGSGVRHGASCLLYTSDAADERSSVDLGGRRIIKKQKSVCSVANRRVRKTRYKSIGIELTR